MTHEWIRFNRGAFVSLLLGTAVVMGAVRAQAQAVGSGAIRGRVADESGAAAPGVTVTVSSPSLQLRERTAISEPDGQYQMPSLPLGTYTVRFELTGFQSVVREGILLSAGFEARVDAVLKLSRVEETITVSGQSPVIDVSTTTISSNLSHEVLDSIPTSRSIGEAIALAPGVRYAGAIDVGGNRTGQFANGGTNFGSDEQSPFLEGINTRLFEGGSMAYLDQRALDDIQVTAVGSSAEFATPGLAWTGVVKSGGNDFHGLFSYDGQYPWLQGNNVDAALLAQGIDPSGNSIKSYYDFTAQLGGRIIRDQLWFFGAIRSIKRVSNELGFSESRGPDGKYGTADDPLATRTMWNPGQTLKVSYQPATEHRFVGFVSRSIKNERERGASRFVPLESTWNYWYDPTPWKLEYQWTPTNRVMVNAMYGDSSYLAQWRPQAGADVPGNPMTTDINTGFTTGPAAVARNPNTNHQINASMNYYPERALLGRHELKAGFQYYIPVYGVDYPDLASGNYIRTLDNGVPYQIRTEDRPVVADSKLDNPNLFFTDTWRIGRRVTANLGLRVEHHHLFSRGGVKQASQFGTAATYGDHGHHHVERRRAARRRVVGHPRQRPHRAQGAVGSLPAHRGRELRQQLQPGDRDGHHLHLARLEQQPAVRRRRSGPRSERQGLRQPGAALERIRHQHDAAADREPGPAPAPHRRNVSHLRAGTGRQHGVPRAAGLQAGRRYLRQREDPSSLLGVEHPHHAHRPGSGRRDRQRRRRRPGDVLRLRSKISWRGVRTDDAGESRQLARR